MPRMSADDSRSTTARALAILDVVAQATVSGMTLSQIAEAAKLPVPTAHRYVKELVAWGGLERSEAGAYRLGMHLWQLGTHARWDRTVRQVSAPILDKLAKATGVAACVASFIDGRVVTIDRRWGRTTSTWISPIGVEIPAEASTVGRAIVAVRGTVEQFAQFMPGATPDEVAAEFERTNQLGYSALVGKLHETQGAISVAVPGRFAQDLALTLVFPADEPDVVQHVEQLRLAAAALAVALRRESES